MVSNVFVVCLQNEILKSQYGLEDEHILLLAQAVQTFVKRNYPTYEEKDYGPKFMKEYHGWQFPFNCTTFPWNATTQTLWTTDMPGEPNAICELDASYYCADQTSLDKFYYMFMGIQYTSGGELGTLQDALYAMDVDTQCEVAKIFVKRAGFDGEMAGSGAAMDPLFWVAHGSVERLLQKAIIEGASSDLVYNATTAACSGHLNEVRPMTCCLRLLRW
jgi:hypothetical protein